jgi:hypothetical protein
VEFEDTHWELDFNKVEYELHPAALHPAQPLDPYNEFMSKDKFEKLLSEVWAQRLQVSEINQKLSKVDHLEGKGPACEFELQYVIGRRAFDRRMNIKIDCRDRIVYIASSLLIFLTENDEDNEALIEEGLNSKIK